MFNEFKKKFLGNISKNTYFALISILFFIVGLEGYAEDYCKSQSLGGMNVPYLGCVQSRVMAGNPWHICVYGSNGTLEWQDASGVGYACDPQYTYDMYWTSGKVSSAINSDVIIKNYSNRRICVAKALSDSNPFHSSGWWVLSDERKNELNVGSAEYLSISDCDNHDLKITTELDHQQSRQLCTINDVFNFYAPDNKQECLRKNGRMLTFYKVPKTANGVYELEIFVQDPVIERPIPDIIKNNKRVFGIGCVLEQNFCIEHRSGGYKTDEAAIKFVYFCLDRGGSPFYDLDSGKLGDVCGGKLRFYTQKYCLSAPPGGGLIGNWIFSYENQWSSLENFCSQFPSTTKVIEK